MVSEKFLEQWKEPGCEFRSFPFWAWNDRMDPQKVRAQVRQMRQAGIGGFFIHSRDGLETEYLGEEWMNCVRAAVDEAKKQKMYAWLYDEDRFPSGTAGGRVPGYGDAFRCKGLTLEVLETGSYPQIYEHEIQTKTIFHDLENGLLAAYAAKISGDEIFEFRRLQLRAEEVFEADEKLLVVRLEVSAPSEWFNYEAPPDNLNPDCVKMFIEETHEKYWKVVGEEFGKTIPGIFTDEPSLHDRHAFFGEKRSWIPWTYGYGEYFTQKNGYDFLEVLPLFYFNGNASAKTRSDYWHTIALRYGESYFQTIGAWCKDHHLQFTGHFLQEDKMGLGARVNGAIMPNYQYQQIPGIDMLCEQTGEYLTVKQCVSVARQLGKQRVITETYGCTGWDFTFEGQKWMGDWQYILGVNCRCQHMALYSLRGCRKRDYPPSINYNTSWWGDYRPLEDYFARLSFALTQGEAVCEILVLHPLSNVWSQLGASPYGNPVRRNERDVPKLNDYGEQFNRLIEKLERSHFDVDLGDEILISQYAKIKDRKFLLGNAAYSVVVIPDEMDFMLESTKTILDQFEAEGGKILRMHLGDCTEILLEQLESVRTVSIEDGNGNQCKDILYQLRKTENGYLLFLVNNSREHDATAKVILPFVADGVELCPTDAQIRPIASIQNGAMQTTFFAHLEATGSALYWLEPLHSRQTKITKGETFFLNQENVMPLDQCRFRLDDGDWSETMEVWQAQREIRSRFGMRQIFRNGIWQRYQWIKTPHPEDGHKLELEFSFLSQRTFERLDVAVERINEFEICLNGVVQNGGVDGWILDESFEKKTLSHVCAGENCLVLSCRYRNDMELENIYLVGRFGVTPNRVLTDFPKELVFGDWTQMGLTHYCGSVTWKCKWKRENEDSKVVIQLPKTSAVFVKIFLNGNEQMLTHDFTREISAETFLRLGENEITVLVMGSPRNMMGPFHVKEKPKNTNDASFSPEETAYCSDYLLEPYGLMGPITITEIWK